MSRGDDCRYDRSALTLWDGLSGSLKSARGKGSARGDLLLRGACSLARRCRNRDDRRHRLRTSGIRCHLLSLLFTCRHGLRVGLRNDDRALWLSGDDCGLTRGSDLLRGGHLRLRCDWCTCDRVGGDRCASCRLADRGGGGCRWRRRSSGTCRGCERRKVS